MKLTDRDIRIVKDVSLSHVLSRDQVTHLYFGSVSRANVRLKLLTVERLLKVIDTPFFGQHLYAAGANAAAVVGERVHRLLTGRKPTPTFLQHSLAVTEVRLALLTLGAHNWRFEPQIKQTFGYHGATLEVRPDGYLIGAHGPTFLEVDLGHVATRKFRKKIQAFEAFQASGVFSETYGAESFTLLVVTTGSVRAMHLASLAGRCRLVTQTFGAMGIATPGSWS